jgi:hypothetical protein
VVTLMSGDDILMSVGDDVTMTLMSINDNLMTL